MRLIYTFHIYAFTFVIYQTKPKDRHIRKSNDLFRIMIFFITQHCAKKRDTSLIHFNLTILLHPSPGCISSPLSVADSQQPVSLARAFMTNLHCGIQRSTIPQNNSVPTMTEHLAADDGSLRLDHKMSKYKSVLFVHIHMFRCRIIHTCGVLNHFFD